MDNEQNLIDLLEIFSVGVVGLDQAENNLERLKKKWFLHHKSNFEKSFLEMIIPKLEAFEKKSNKEVKSLLDKEGKKFLKSYKE